MDDLISRKAAIDALWKALYKYEDETEKQFQESDELDVGDWFQHRIFVQNMSDIDRQTILGLPSVQPAQKTGKWIYIPTKRLLDETDDGPVYITERKCFCSNCNTDFGFRRLADAYCRVCGAKMEDKG